MVHDDSGQRLPGILLCQKVVPTTTMSAETPIFMTRFSQLSPSPSRTHSTTCHISVVLVVHVIVASFSCRRPVPEDVIRFSSASTFLLCPGEDSVFNTDVREEVYKDLMIIIGTAVKISSDSVSGLMDLEAHHESRSGPDPHISSRSQPKGLVYRQTSLLRQAAGCPSISLAVMLIRMSMRIDDEVADFQVWPPRYIHDC
jgi:hypothetical protein